MKSLGDLVRNAITEAVMKCSEEYGFSGAEALDKLNLDRMEILSKLSAKKSNVQKTKVASIPFPFMGAVAGLCCGLKQNYGLYTQCPKSVASDIQFCKGCEKSEKNVHDRSDPEFKDSKGRPPKSYSSVMKKLKLTKKTLTVHIFCNLQNHPNIHSEDRLVNLARGRECFVGLSI